MKGMAAFILAGGVGKRLSILTTYRAKPAVPFAGKYRIIDYTLTNCVRSGISDVHILTQYISSSLMRHLGIGKPWDLDRLKGGLHILHPRLGYEGADWYMGTADAIYQNSPIIRKLDHEHILILSGDHVYNMDYSKFLDFHLASGKKASLAVIEVPGSLCSEFGIATLDKSGKIVRFEEKPLRSRSNLASMGIYIFDREFLLSILSELKPSFHDLDFGKHIIPELVRSGGISAYSYSGKWLDIGTLSSYYSASLALLSERSGFGSEREGSVLTVSDDSPPALIGAGSRIRRSLVCNGCYILGKVSNSILSPGVVVEDGASIENSIILHRCHIKRGARIRNSIIDKMSVIGPGATIGEGNRRRPNKLQPDYLDFGLTIVGRKTIIPGGISIGTNCLVAGSLKKGRIPSRDIEDGGAYISPDTKL